MKKFYRILKMYDENWRSADQQICELQENGFTIVGIHVVEPINERTQYKVIGYWKIKEEKKNEHNK